MNIVLTGFMASGKSVISKCLSKLTGLSVTDTDEYIEQNEGISINEIFRIHGEEYFRKLEKEAVTDVSRNDNIIISTGGGTVLDKENTEVLRKHGSVVYLAPEFEIIEKRIYEAAKTRPLLQNQSIEDIRNRFEARRPFYENCDFKLHITEEMSPDDCAKEILKLIKQEKN